jgi:hypothetical protein
MSCLKLPYNQSLTRSQLRNKLPNLFDGQGFGSGGEDGLREHGRERIEKASDDDLSAILIALGCTARDVWRELEVEWKRTMVLDWWDTEERGLKEREAQYPALKEEWIKAKEQVKELQQRIRDIEDTVPLSVLDPAECARQRERSLFRIC